MDQARAFEIISSFQGRAAKFGTPVDVRAIAEALGVNVYTDKLKPGVSGILRRDERIGGSSGYAILVNQEHPMNRQRFTVAHEIAHFVLHRDDAAKELVEDEFYRALSNPLEREANEFAAELLMPWGLINEASEKGATDLPQLARSLRVSQQALAIRLGLPYDQDWK